MQPTLRQALRSLLLYNQGNYYPSPLGSTLKKKRFESILLSFSILGYFTVTFFLTVLCIETNYRLGENNVKSTNVYTSKYSQECGENVTKHDLTTKNVSRKGGPPLYGVPNRSREEKLRTCNLLNAVVEPGPISLRIEPNNYMVDVMLVCNCPNKIQISVRLFP